MSRHRQDAGDYQENAPMEQVRELLFGSQLKGTETRMVRQEERLMREITDVRDALKSRLDSLENFMKSETGSLLGRLQQGLAEQADALKAEQRERVESVRAEQRERIEAVKAEQRERDEAVKAEQRERVEALARTARDLAAAEESFSGRLAKISNTLDSTERELRQLLLGENSALAAKVEARYQDALNVLSNTAAQIRHDMVYRAALSNMLTEVAVKLSGRWTLDMAHMLTMGDGSPSDAADDGSES
jgi:phenylalanyl-tRNA synthetase alpha subunit